MLKLTKILTLTALLFFMITGCSESDLDYSKLYIQHKLFYKDVKAFIERQEKDANITSRDSISKLLQDTFQAFVDSANKKNDGLISFSIDDTVGTQIVNEDTAIIGEVDTAIIIKAYRNTLEGEATTDEHIKLMDHFVRMTVDNRRVILMSDSAMFVSYPWQDNNDWIYKIALGQVVGSKNQYIVYTSDNLTKKISLQISEAQNKIWSLLLAVIVAGSIITYFIVRYYRRKSRTKMKSLLNTIIGKIRENEKTTILDDYNIARNILKKNVIEVLLKVIEIRNTEGLKISLMFPDENHRLKNYEYQVSQENDEINIQEIAFNSNWLPVGCFQKMSEYIRHIKSIPYHEKPSELIVLRGTGYQDLQYIKDPFEDYETVCFFPLMPNEKENKILGLLGVYSPSARVIPGRQEEYLRHLAFLISLLIQNYQYARRTANTVHKSLGNIISAKLFQKAEAGNETLIDDINLVNREILKGIAQPLIMLFGYTKEEAEGMSVCLGLVDEAQNKLDCLIVENPKFRNDQPGELIIESFGLEETISYNLSESNRPAIWCVKRNTPIYSSNWARDLRLDKYNDYEFSLKDAPTPKYGLPAVSLAYYPLCQADTTVFGIFSVQNVKMEVDFESEVFQNIIKSTAEHLQASILGFIKLTQKQKQIELIRDISRLILHESKNKFQGFQFSLDDLGSEIKKIEKTNLNPDLETIIWKKFNNLNDNIKEYGANLKNDHNWIKSISFADYAVNDEVNLKELIESVCNEFKLFNIKVDLQEVDETLEIFSNEMYLKLIFSTLFYNSVAYKVPEKAVEIKVSVNLNDSLKKTIIRIKDNGKGIDNPEQLLDDIRTRSITELKGVGLKLAIEHIEKRLKGKFAIINSVKNQGTEIEIEL